MADPRTLRRQQYAEYVSRLTEQNDEEMSRLFEEAGLTNVSPFEQNLRQNPEELAQRIRALASAKAQRSMAVSEGAQAVLDQSIRDNLFKGFGAAFSDFSSGTNRLRELQGEEDAARRTAVAQAPISEADAAIERAVGELDAETQAAALRQTDEQLRLQNVQRGEAEKARRLEEKVSPIRDAIKRADEEEKARLDQRETEAGIALKLAQARKADADALEAAGGVGGTGKDAASVQLLRERQRPQNQFTTFLTAVDQMPNLDEEIALLTSEDEASEKYREQTYPQLDAEEAIAKRVAELQGKKDELRALKSESFASYRVQIRRTADKTELRTIIRNIEEVLQDPSLDANDRAALAQMQALAEQRWDQLPKK